MTGTWPTTVGGARDWTGVPGETPAERVERILAWAEAADVGHGAGSVRVPLDEIRWLTALARQVTGPREYRVEVHILDWAGHGVWVADPRLPRAESAADARNSIDRVSSRLASEYRVTSAPVRQWTVEEEGDRG